MLFEIFRPLISGDSIQYANFDDGKHRRKVYDPAFQHAAMGRYFHVFVEVNLIHYYTTVYILYMYML